MEDLIFMKLYREGIIKESAMDDYIHEWHNGDSELELHEFLGMTEDEYKVFIETGELD